MKAWTWGEDTYATQAEVEEAIAGYVVEEMNSHDLQYVDAPDGTRYVIRIRADLMVSR